MTTIDTIWLVHGSTGQYSDHMEWIVCGYKTEEEAKRHSELAQARADELNRDYANRWHLPKGANEWDSFMRTDYNGTRYTYSMVEVKTFKA